MSDITYEQAVRDLYAAIKTDADNFSAKLVRLILKADRTNFQRLIGAYPEHCKVIMDWHDSPNEEEFFKLHLKRK